MSIPDEILIRLPQLGLLFGFPPSGFELNNSTESAQIKSEAELVFPHAPSLFEDVSVLVASPGRSLHTLE